MNLNISSQPESQLPLRAEVRSEFRLSSRQLPLAIANFTKFFQKVFKLGPRRQASSGEKQCSTADEGISLHAFWD